MARQAQSEDRSRLKSRHTSGKCLRNTASLLSWSILARRREAGTHELEDRFGKLLDLRQDTNLAVCLGHVRRYQSERRHLRAAAPTRYHRMCEIEGRVDADRVVMHGNLRLVILAAFAAEPDSGENSALTCQAFSRLAPWR